MRALEPTLLEIGVRVYTEIESAASKSVVHHPWSDYVLVFDTETTVDKLQALIFGAYRLCEWKDRGTALRTREEGLIYADDLPKRDPEVFALLQAYAARRAADVGPGVPKHLKLRSRDEFVDEVFWKIAYKARGTIAGFNLPFDLSRIAIHSGAARGVYRGGHSLDLWRWRNPKTGRWESNKYRPRVNVKHVHSKLAFMRFTKPRTIDPDDQLPEPGVDPDGGAEFQGHFLDLRTLTFALTTRGHSLACAFRPR